MCTLRDVLVERARAGDQGALDLLIMAAPRELPASVRLAARNQAIRDIAVSLAAAIPGRKDIPGLIAKVGRNLDRGAGSASRALPQRVCWAGCRLITTAAVAVPRDDLFNFGSWKLNGLG